VRIEGQLVGGEARRASGAVITKGGATPSDSGISPRRFDPQDAGVRSDERGACSVDGDLDGVGDASFFENEDVSFGQWWAMTVLRDAAGRTWSRKKLVLDLANKEGGAHLDPRQPEAID